MTYVEFLCVEEGTLVFMRKLDLKGDRRYGIVEQKNGRRIVRWENGIEGYFTHDWQVKEIHIAERKPRLRFEGDK